MLRSKTSAGRSPAMDVARRKRGSAPDLDVVGWFFMDCFCLLGASAREAVLVGLVRLKDARHRCGLPISTEIGARSSRIFVRKKKSPGGRSDTKRTPKGEKPQRLACSADCRARRKRTPIILRDLHHQHLTLCEQSLRSRLPWREESEVLCWRRLTNLTRWQIVRRII